jgi:hypothetical protein
MAEPARVQRRSLLVPAAFVAFGAAWAVLAWYLSRQVAAHPNSDAASVMLVGWDMFHGNVLLHGWQLTADPFWTSDALVFGAVASVIGLSETVMRVEVVAVAVAVLLLALRLATVDARRRLLAAVPVVVVLCLAPTAFRSMFLTPVVHVMTVAYCLAAFLLLRRPSRARAVGAAVLLALAVIGDAAAYAVGVLPVAVVALVGLARPTLRRLSVWRLGAAVVGAGAGFAVLHLARALGGFTLAPPLQTPPPSLWPHNLFRFAPMLARQDVGGARLVLCAAGVVACLVLFLIGTFRRSPVADEWSAGVLAAGAFGGLALFVYVALPQLGTPEARYLTPTVIYAAVAAGVALGRVAVPARAAWALTAMAAVGLVVAAVGPVRSTTRPLSPPASGPVLDWLEAHHLVDGIAPYWDASSLVVASGNRVRPRPVLTVDGQLMARRYNSKAAWFDTPPRYLVYEDQFTSAHGGEVDLASAVAAFGPPVQKVTLGRYHVMVWHRTHPLPAWLGG